MKPEPKIDRTWIAICAVFCVYAALFILRTSFVIAGVRYFSLFDDAMISMAYARNLAEGHGLVWNAGGERVEGITNLGWTLYMALLHLLPVAKAKTSLLVQASSAGLVLAGAFFTRKTAAAISNGSRFVWIGSALAAAFYLPIVSWSLQGMEVGLLILLINAALYKTIRSIESGVFSGWPYVLLAAAILVRLDMAVPFAVVLTFMCLKDRANRRRHLGWGIGLLAAVVASQTVFRVLYYGDLLPNTYYHKLTGYPIYARVLRGLYVTLVFIWRLNWVLVLVPVALLFLRRVRTEMLLACVFAGQLAYSVYVGGDAWENWGGSNRYVCAAMPCFFILFFQGAETIGLRLRGYLAMQHPGLGKEAAARIFRRSGIAVIVLALLSFNAIYGPAAFMEMILVKRTLHVDDNRRMVERGLVIGMVTAPEARVAFVWDGAPKYFSERPGVSILGKNDRKIAHQKMHRAEGANLVVGFYPGHLKWDYAYSIGELKPDVIAQLWQDPETASPYLSRDYTQIRVGGFGVHFRKDSPHIRWERVQSLSAGG